MPHGVPTTAGGHVLYTDTPIAGCVEVDVEWYTDERGAFARAFDVEEFTERGLGAHMSQSNISVTRRAGTVRGMHYQRGVSAEAKYVRCGAGRVFDVAVDIRPSSPTYLEWHGRELTAEGCEALYVPRGCAHGFMALEPDSVVNYMNTHNYDPEREGGLRPDDPGVGIEWPLPITMMSDKDRAWPLVQR